MKALLFACTLALASPVLADDCVTHDNPDAAYKGQVEALLFASGLKAVPRKNIIATVTVEQDIHDPEFNVILANGALRHVTCDDSGDDQCGCKFAE